MGAIINRLPLLVFLFCRINISIDRNIFYLPGLQKFLQSLVFIFKLKNSWNKKRSADVVFNVGFVAMHHQHLY